MFSIRAAHTLNSGIRLVGSSAGLVRRLTACIPPQWKGAKTVSSRMLRVIFTVKSAAPRRVKTRTGSPSLRPCRRAVSGCNSARGAGVMSVSSAMRRVWAPDWYCDRLRPVVRYSGYSASGSSAGAEWRTAWNRARPLDVGNPSVNMRGVPGWSGAGHGQNTPLLASIFS